MGGQMTWDGEPILQEFPSDWSALELINGRMQLKVSKQELLFPKPNAFAEEGDAEPKVRELSACAPDARSKAEAQCRKALGADGSAQVLEACVFDRCFGGAGFDN